MRFRSRLFKFWKTLKKNLNIHFIFAGSKPLQNIKAMSDVHNFSAGPAILPKEAINKSIKSLQDFKNSGLSVVEISHRSPEWSEEMKAARELVKELLNVPSGYSVLFLQGGASTQFLMVPYNFLKKKAAYVNTGNWSKKAIKEAGHFGEVLDAGSSKDQIPRDIRCPADASYLHITTNNTIYGTQYKTFPQCDCPLIADMSSDIFSREIDVSKFDLIYAGAQKNMGPAGTTLVIIKDKLLDKVVREVPSMMDYRIHLDKDSMFNTPPVFAVHLSALTLRWLKEAGGIKEIQKRNEEKARTIYREIDENPMFEGTVNKEDRSTMNATFVLKDDSLKDEFFKYLNEANIKGLKGHRSVGGFRASMYNAMPLDSVNVLVEVMREFAKKYA